MSAYHYINIDEKANTVCLEVEISNRELDSALNNPLRSVLSEDNLLTSAFGKAGA